MIKTENLAAARDAAFTAMRQAFTTMSPDMLQSILQSIKEEIKRRSSQAAEKIVVDLTIAGELSKNAGGEILFSLDATIASLTANAQRWVASFPDQALQAALECLEFIPDELDAVALHEQLSTFLGVMLAKIIREERDRRLRNSNVT